MDNLSCHGSGQSNISMFQEMYNNIVIYIVGHSTDESMSPNEMHIFQCVNVSARDVVEDLKAFKQGRYR